MARPRFSSSWTRYTERKKRFGALCHRVKNPPNYTVLNGAPKATFSPFWGPAPKWGTVVTPHHFFTLRVKTRHRAPTRAQSGSTLGHRQILVAMRGAFRFYVLFIF